LAMATVEGLEPGAKMRKHCITEQMTTPQELLR